MPGDYDAVWTNHRLFFMVALSLSIARVLRHRFRATKGTMPVTNPDLQITGGRGGGRETSLQEKNSSALRASVCSKNKGGGGTPGPSPGSATE